MIRNVLLLGLAGYLLSWLATGAMIYIAPLIGLVDRPGGRKIHDNPKPLGGGVAIFLAVALPLLAGLFLYAWAGPHPDSPMIADEHLRALVRGARQQTPLALWMISAAAVLHVMGLIDDRKALGPYVKLAVQLLAAGALVFRFNEVRAITALGYWPSVILTTLWIVAITNAFNFLDNMDGLSAGVAAVCATSLLVTTLLIEQWFVAATLALLVGALLGFLCWNFPPARIFMGDSGSLVIGFLLGVLTVRTTYLTPEHQANFGAGWYSVFAPVIVLALPLYDLIVVSIIRISRGKSPFVGDTNHFSHRLVARGMTRRTAVLCLYLVSAATSIAAVVLPYVSTRFAAMLIFGQTVLILCLVALLEQHPLPAARPVEPPQAESGNPT